MCYNKRDALSGLTWVTRTSLSQTTSLSTPDQASSEPSLETSHRASCHSHRQLSENSRHCSGKLQITNVHLALQLLHYVLTVARLYTRSFCGFALGTNALLTFGSWLVAFCSELLPNLTKTLAVCLSGLTMQRVSTIWADERAVGIGVSAYLFNQDNSLK